MKRFFFYLFICLFAYLFISSLTPPAHATETCNPILPDLECVYDSDCGSPHQCDCSGVCSRTIYVPPPGSTPVPTTPPSSCSCPSPVKDCTRPAYPACSSPSNQCFAVCNYSTSPCSWSCTGDSSACTEAECTNWNPWYCNTDGTETQYCTAPARCTNVARARTPCGVDLSGTPYPTDPPPGPTNAPIPTPIPKSCSVSISGSNITLSGANAPEGNNIKLWLARQDKAAINPAPANQYVYTETGPPLGSYTSYLVDGCDASAAGSCSKTYSIPSTLPAGDYYFHCDVQTDPDKCSGQPFCNYENPPMPGGKDCTGYRSCSSNDSLTYTSTPTPTNTPIPPTVTPIPPTATPIPPPILSCSATFSGINWSWTGTTINYWLQVWGDIWKANGWGYTSPTFTTGTPDVTYNGRVQAGDGTQSSPWSNTATCTVPPLPACTISASPSSIDYYSASTITWSSTNATSCSISPPGWTGTSGSQNTGNLTSTTTYTATCSRAGDGSTTSCQTQVLVGAPATPTLTCTAYTNPASIIWDWTTSSGPLSYWLQVWDDVWKANQWYGGPTVTTTATPGIPYYGRVLAGDGSQSSTWSTTKSCTVPVPSTPTGACGSFNNNPTNPATPVTWTWTNGTGIQVYDDTGKWWANIGNITSPYTVTKDNNNLGSTLGIPPGRTVYARTTYDFITFSTWGLISPSPTCPLPPNPSPVTVSGPLQQKSGTGCFQANATDNFTVQNPTTTTNPSSCVATSCTVSPNNNAAQTYTCTTIFSSNDCLNDDPPTWPTSATVTLTGIAPPGYTLTGWTPNGSCTPPTNSKTVNAGETIANQPLTFNFSGENWMKLKSSSFNGVSVTNITVPAFVTNYDADDDGLKYFISGIGGSVLNKTVLPNSDPLNLHYSNPNNWYDSSYAVSLSMHPSDFLSYVKSRKEYKTISDLSSTSIDKDGIYVWDGTVAFPDITNATSIPDKNFVLISTVKPITISRTNFVPTKSVAIVASNITFGDTTQTANGIFIAQTIDTGSNNNLGLKIKGNLISQSTLTNGRSWSDTSRPRLFIVFDPVQYINLLPYLSTASYEWRQIQ